MKHPHAIALEKFYAEYTRGHLAAAAEVCAEGMTFQVPGKSRLAGKYTRSAFGTEYATKLRELSQGTFKFEAHDILVSDLHATVLGMNQLIRDDKSIEIRTVHVWRFENGKPLAGYEYPRDLHQFDAAWGA